MSNSLAISAVTLTLRNLIFQGVNADLAGTTVSTNPLDRARVNAVGNQVNLFMYHTALDGAWRNTDMPRQVKPGETGNPPLPLNLYYLVTAYGENDDETLSHRLLGRTMTVLHDHPVLGSDEIRAALPNNDLYQQVERVRVTPQPLSLEEVSKLWTAFQTQYRISAAYQASVVLLESTRAARAPLPVLTQGPGDRGPTAVGGVLPPFPFLESVTPPNNQPSARLGDQIVLSGHNLDGAKVVVRFASQRLAAPIDVPPPELVSATAESITAILRNDPASVPAGFYTVAALIQRRGVPDYLTNELSLSVAPRITTNLPLQLALDATGNADLVLTCSPQILPEQNAYLLLGERPVLAAPRAAQTDTLRFAIRGAPRDSYLIRLRVDGVDSLLVDRSVQPPLFDQTQMVTLT